MPWALCKTYWIEVWFYLIFIIITTNIIFCQFFFCSGQFGTEIENVAIFMNHYGKHNLGMVSTFWKNRWIFARWSKVDTWNFQNYSANLSAVKDKVVKVVLWVFFLVICFSIFMLITKAGTDGVLLKSCS